MPNFLATFVVGCNIPHQDSNFKLDAQQYFMPRISRMQADIQIYSFSSMDEQYMDKFGKLLWQVCNSTRMLISNGLSLWPNTNGFICINKLHNGNSVIDYDTILFGGTLDHIHKFLLGEWTIRFNQLELLCVLTSDVWICLWVWELRRQLNTSKFQTTRFEHRP